MDMFDLKCKDYILALLEDKWFVRIQQEECSPPSTFPLAATFPIPLFMFVERKEEKKKSERGGGERKWQN